MENVFSRVRSHPRASELYETTIESIYRRVVSIWSTVVDGGANGGRHTIPLAQAVSKGHVYAFEPIPAVAQVLRERLQAAGLICRATIREAALAERPGHSTFNFVDEPSKDPRFPLANAALSGLRHSQDFQRRYHSRELIVETTTLDADLSHVSDEISFIKLDLEGGEYHALRAAGGILRQKRPLLVFEDGGPWVGSVYGYEPEDLLTLLRSCGYQLYYITGHRFSNADWLARTRPEGGRPYYTVAAPEAMDIGWLLRRLFNDECRKIGMEPLFCRHTVAGGSVACVERYCAAASMA